MDRHCTIDRIVLEASSSGKYAARLLRDHGFNVHMANPRKMKSIYESYKKTDKNDTRILAKKLREGELPESYLPSREIDEIRSLVRYRRTLGDETTMIKNQVHAILARNGITIEATDIFGKRSLKTIEESATRIQPADAYQYDISNYGSTFDGQQVHAALYNIYQYYAQYVGSFHDITSGSNGPYSAGNGYDLVTGLGSPNIVELIGELDGLING